MEWRDLDRPPLRQDLLAARLAGTVIWTDVRVVDEVTSTNDVVRDAARAGADEGLVVVAETQTGGRGRLDRHWVSPPRAGLTFSVLLRPRVAVSRWSWLPLLVGEAVASGAARATGIDVRLKWPNDLLVEGRKVGGLLAEVDGTAAVVGVGLNVLTRRDELPRADATSLALESSNEVDRLPVLLAVLREIAPVYLAWAASGGDARMVAPAYRARCVTIGQDVDVSMPDGSVLSGRAVDVDDDGRLVVSGPDGETTVTAGDVVHVRPAE